MPFCIGISSGQRRWRNSGFLRENLSQETSGAILFGSRPTAGCTGRDTPRRNLFRGSAFHYSEAMHPACGFWSSEKLVSRARARQKKLPAALF